MAKLLRIVARVLPALSLAVGIGSDARGDWPQPRLTSLSRIGCAVGESVDVSLLGPAAPTPTLPLRTDVATVVSASAVTLRLPPVVYWPPAIQASTAGVALAVALLVRPANSVPNASAYDVALV